MRELDETRHGYRQQILGKGDITLDAWGRQKTISDFSIMHGVFSNGIQLDKWKVQEDGTEILDPTDPANFTATLTNAPARSENGMLKVESVVAGSRFTFRSLRHPRYQPNRGHLFSDANLVVGGTGGTLYAVTRTTVDDATNDIEIEIQGVEGIDFTKGNVTDIQMQWRGVGDFTYYINLESKYKTGLLGSRSDLSVSNPALPIMYEAYKGTDATTDPSYVIWGVGTEENGVFYKYSYNSTVDAAIKVGCCDITSEGGDSEHLSYGSVTSGTITTVSSSNEKQILAIRVPDNRSTYDSTGTAYDTINTRDLILSSISTGQSDEHSIRVYTTRDASAIQLVGGTWARNWSDDVDFVTDTGSGANFTWTKASFAPIFETQVELDIPYTKTNPIGGRGDFYLTAGTIVVVTMQPTSNGSDTVSITAEFGSEK